MLVFLVVIIVDQHRQAILDLGRNFSKVLSPPLKLRPDDVSVLVEVEQPFALVPSLSEGGLKARALFD